LDRNAVNKRRYGCKNVLRLLLPGVAAACVLSAGKPLALMPPAEQVPNSPPSVRITAPPNHGTFEWDTQVRYTLRVSDAEDGDSQYQEIAPSEVILEVRYLPDASRAAEYVQQPQLVAFKSPGLALIRRSDCFGCHAVQDKLTGPPFAEIAKRYPHNAATVTLLAHRIVQGNAGVWGGVAMPPHPDFSRAQAEQIAGWILENTNDPDRCYYPGTEGSFRTRSRPTTGPPGAYVITASYTDHGPKDAEGAALQGHHAILLRAKP
jgi:cytochrome c